MWYVHGNRVSKARFTTKIRNKTQRRISVHQRRKKKKTKKQNPEKNFYSLEKKEKEKKKKKPEEESLFIREERKKNLRNRNRTQACADLGRAAT